MGETTVEDASGIRKPKPTTILVPPRGSMESLFSNGSIGGFGFSPGPMTLVSNYFAEQGPFSFSQLLAGAMSSPTTGLLMTSYPPAAAEQEEEKEKEKEKESNSSDDGKNSVSGGRGYKRNRPMDLVVAQPQMPPESLSPMFMVPPGLSPSGFLNSPGFLSPLSSPFGMSHRQALAHVTAQAAFSQTYMQMQSQLQQRSPSIESLAPHHQTSIIPVSTEPDTSKIDSFEVSQSDKKSSYIVADKPANDGYNWRKYGQKNVKASECPRSYYKCTYINCPVKKKVERSFDGRVSEITYKGHHIHEPPQSNKRGKDGCALDKTIKSQAKSDEMNRLNEAAYVKCEPVNFQATTQRLFERNPMICYNGEVGDSVVVVDDCGNNDDDDDEPISKRRSVDNGQSITASTHETITETKIVVQTRSEVDLLDDGYKWRKYGQKVVKGNPHPRSYYRCTYAGCNVRKHVERASADPKAVITTYEGKHDHELPVGRYSNHGAVNCNSNQFKTQKTANKKPMPSIEMDFGNMDNTPMTLQLKEETIAA
ncbi:hypothetical protein ACP275_08G026600 [Erythranthe tilingii]